MLPQWYIEDPGHSAKSAGGRIHLNMRTTLTQQQFPGIGGTYQESELTRNSSGNTRLQLSQLAEPLWSDPVLMSGISLPEQIATLNNNKQKKA